MDEFVNYILQFGNLNKQQTDFIMSKAKTLELHKEEYFSEAGKIPRYVGFILEGVVRFCYYNNKGEEITHSFVEENNFVSDQQRFEAQVVASEYVQAISHCKLLVFSKKDWDEIGNTVVGWKAIEHLIIKLFVKSDRKTKSIGFGECDHALFIVHRIFSRPDQSCPAVSHCILPRHHPAIVEQDQKKYSLRSLFTKW